MCSIPNYYACGVSLQSVKTLQLGNTWVVSFLCETSTQSFDAWSLHKEIKKVDKKIHLRPEQHCITKIKGHISFIRCWIILAINQLISWVSIKFWNSFLLLWRCVCTLLYLMQVMAFGIKCKIHTTILLLHNEVSLQ